MIRRSSVRSTKFFPRLASARAVLFGFIVVNNLAASSALAAEAPVRWASALDQPAGWYGTPAARALADNVLLYQTVHGGWPKNTEMAEPPTAEARAALLDPKTEATTFDNGGTHTQLRFLARVIAARGADTPEVSAYRASFLRGVDYLLAAQYPNGGWPQFFPLRKGYYTHITFNDDAMIGVMTMLREIASRQAPYEFVGATHRERAARAVAKGIECVLRCQIVAEGKRTAWCAQHDEVTLAPAWARAYEAPSLSGSESVGIVRFLMSIPDPSPEIVAAIEGAVAWFRAVPIRGMRVDTFNGDDGKRDRRMVADATAPLLWARFYELGTNRPLYMGRDSIPRYDYNAVERERRAGYSYAGTWPAALLEKDYPAWVARWRGVKN